LMIIASPQFTVCSSGMRCYEPWLRRWLLWAVKTAIALILTSLSSSLPHVLCPTCGVRLAFSTPSDGGKGLIKQLWPLKPCHSIGQRSFSGCWRGCDIILDDDVSTNVVKCLGEMPPTP
jgi:hypothetical protein